MTVKRQIAGLCLTAALLIGAVFAQPAGAAENTAVECTTTGTQIPGTEKFADAHCKEAKPTGTFFHVATAAGTKVASELTNTTTGTERSPWTLKSTIGGLETILEAKKVSGSGTIENNVSGTEMYAEFLAGTIKLEEVSVTNRTCEFIGVNPGGTKTVGSVEMQPMRITTKGQGAGIVVLEPQAGTSTKLWEYELAGASCPAALKGTLPVFGRVLSNAAEGATVPIVHSTVTSEPSPKLRLKNASEGVLMGIEGRFTLKKTSGGVPVAFTPKAEEKHEEEGGGEEHEPPAAENTAVECTTTGTQIPGTEKFSDEHCKTKSPSGSRFHAATPAATKTPSELSNNTTGTSKEPLIFKMTLGGLETIIEARTVTASGTIENNVSGTEMYAKFLTNSIAFSEVTVTNRSCTFTGYNPGGSKTVGSVESQPIVGTTKGQVAGVMLFEPQAGAASKWWEFELSGASCPAGLKGIYPLFGTVLSSAAEGATLPIVHATVTGESTPKLRLKSTEGPLVGMAGKFTFKKTSGGVPIAFT